MENKFLDIHLDTQITQGNLPHWSQAGKLYFITYRLSDSLPQSKLTEFKDKKTIWLKQHPQPWTFEVAKEYHLQFSQNIDKWLDANYGSCILRIPVIADIVESNIIYNNNTKYLVHGYVIMPNHVHVLVETFEGNSIQQIVHSWKSFTANQIKKILGKSGSIWCRESFDRIIRNEEHYRNVRHYIHINKEVAGVRWML